ncbi:SecD/SecF fusion protein [Paenibacillus shirakamiensis]|uniref:Protein translocase subunit SecD n=1 Tax=Paenibacillus shirakamiensis TaxID=1265935 RepID=A0ABS4JBF3_9BACL|nr:protein translocase subunit SecD [Paenibacillus shirakamiensis]MBP1999005.1 SecD/SecF fusion protein [Paenibacillus shirakamiensis]
MKRIITFVAVIVVCIAVMAGTSPTLLSKMKLGLDLKGGFEILYQAQPMVPGGKITKESLNQTAASLEKRANKLGTSEPEVSTEGADRIRLKLAGVKNEDEVRKTIQKPAVLTFRSKDGKEKSADQYNKIELNGTDFTENGATYHIDEFNKYYVVIIKVKDKSKLAEISKRLFGKNLAIYLDETLLSAPTVRAELTDGTASISGEYTREAAQELRDTINLGALPLKLTEKYSQSVGATLGKLSLDQTLRAGIIGSLIILIFMISVYRIPGLVASFTLIVYTWMLIAFFYFAGVTLTLPGIAAFILGIGMAVDANIITDERIKEELRSGKSILSAVKAGSRTSFRTVMDAHVTTFIAAAVMYGLGTGPVKGFAFVLMLDLIVSIITNIFFSRYLLHLLVKANIIKSPKMLGVKESEIRAL